ncbi:MAG: hypothetical protein QNJ63_18830 [Calothrix sp. MO_192.B10]|nr:hypothetical protein [Calothrix sp. MO_192.B10]
MAQPKGLRRLEATGVQRRKVTKKNKGNFGVSYPNSAMPLFGIIAPHTKNGEGNMFGLSLKIFLLNNVCFSSHLLGSTSFHPTYEGLL